MPHYFFNLCNDNGFLSDPEGLDCSGDAEALQRAAKMIRELVAAEIREGAGIDLGHYISVIEQDRELKRVYFDDVIDIKQRA